MEPKEHPPTGGRLKDGPPSGGGTVIRKVAGQEKIVPIVAQGTLGLDGEPSSTEYQALTGGELKNLPSDEEQIRQVGAGYTQVDPEISRRANARRQIRARAIAKKNPK